MICFFYVSSANPSDSSGFELLVTLPMRYLRTPVMGGFVLSCKRRSLHQNGGFSVW